MYGTVVGLNATDRNNHYLDENLLHRKYWMNCDFILYYFLTDMRISLEENLSQKLGKDAARGRKNHEPLGAAE